MAHNFRIVEGRNVFISKDGNNANTGSDPNLPRKDFYIIPTQSVTTNAVLGTGFYNIAGVFALQRFSGGNTFNADGLVVLNQTGALEVGDRGWGSISSFWNNLSNSGLFVIKGNGFATRVTGLPGRAVFRNTVFKNCLFQNLQLSGLNGSACGVQFTNCVIDEGTCTSTYSTGANPSLFQNNVFVNTSVFLSDVNPESKYTFNNNYVTENVTVVWPDFVASFNLGRFANNNFQGKIDVGGTLYELKKDKAGVDIPSRIGNGIADIADLVGATVYTTRGNFSQDPEFVNLSKGDYWSVSSTSPNIRAVNSFITNIGNSRVQNTIAKADNPTYFDIAESTDLVLTGSDLEFDIASLNNQGTIPSKIIDLGRVMPLENITATMDLLFNSDDAIGTTNNIHVLQVVQEHNTVNAEANPARLTFKMRWTKNSTMPVLASDWDNQGYFTAGEYQVFEINAGAKVSYDGTFRSSGEAEYLTNKSEFVRARYVQFELYVNRGIKIA